MAVQFKEDTGRIMANGSVGKALEWFRWASQVIIIPALIFGGGFMLRTEKFHVEVVEFMKPGPRFVGNDEFTSAQDLRRQILLDMREMMEDLPPDDYEKMVDERFKAVDTRLNDIHAGQQEILRLLRRR